MFEKIIEKIKKALDYLGVVGKLTAYQMGDRVIVKINSQDFGIWDTYKNTFID